ncbi:MULTISPECIES: type II secretion system protein GspK [Aeromonas]|uniref:general secretion pathway protein GspK n=1 Tax=Aeromonas TaxID=642 RepID=UPI0004939ACE|nr:MULTISPECIES: type II secretion system protein GspK [Aeromonas]QWL79159.1 general secretion pathway protein GspK [Aeromonas hydrophila]
MSHRPINKKERGFVLIAVLGLLMVMSIVAAFVAAYAEQRTRQAIVLRQSWQDRLDQQSTIATLLHLVATRPRVAQGYALSSPRDLRLAEGNVPVLAADSRVYQGIGKSRFAIQDEGALLSLLDPDRDRWHALLKGRGLAPIEADRVLDLLLDYTDQDDLRRLNGANDADYLARGLLKPTHRLMVGPGEFFNLLEANQWSWAPSLLPMLTTRSGQLLNLNTMPLELLGSLSGIDRETAATLVSLRQQRPFSSLADANTRVGKLLPLTDEQVPSIVSIYTRLMVWRGDNECRQQKWIGISLSPSSTQAPWEIDYAFTFDHEQSCGAPQSLVVAPLFPAPVAG